MTLLETLVAARARIADPKNWTVAADARTAGGFCVSAWSERATCWCAVGALQAEYGGYGAEYQMGLAHLVKAAQALHQTNSVIDLNDDPSLGHSAVLKIYDKAIEEARKEG